MANRRFTQFFYTLHNYPVYLDCNFTVTPTNGAGITSLVGPGISSIFMHTSTTPSTGNPNPAAGYVYARLSDQYKNFYGFDWSITPPVTGSAINISDSTVMTLGVPYQIVTVGTSTTANWVAMGLPVGVVPAAGVMFFATATGAGSGTGTVKALTVSGISAIEVLGNSQSQLLSSAPGGGYLAFKCLAPSFAGTALGTHTHDLLLKNAAVSDGATTRVNAGSNLLGANTGSDITITGSGANGGVVAASAGTPAGTGSLAVAAPATGSIISLRFYLSNSRILNGGE